MKTAPYQRECKGRRQKASGDRGVIFSLQPHLGGFSLGSQQDDELWGGPTEETVPFYQPWQGKRQFFFNALILEGCVIDLFNPQKGGRYYAGERKRTWAGSKKTRGQFT